MSEIGAPKDTWADALNEAPAREPVKRWRNLWRVRDGLTWTDGTREDHWGRKAWPTHDAAATYAAERQSAHPGLIWLGAHPDPQGDA